MTRYSVVGLGKLGACMATAIASRGHSVVGVDVEPSIVALVARGSAPVVEPGLQELMTAHRERLRATARMDDAIADSDVTFVVVPTPSDPSGGFSVRYAASAFEAIGAALARKDAYHLVVLVSTVLPGSTRTVLLPALEAASGKSAGRDFGLCYSPEFIALGSVIRDFLNPDLVLIGEHDARAGETLERAYSEIVTNGAPTRRMSIENAELTKISLNSFVTMKISFANMIADLCERIPGGDVDVVTEALGHDRRIGRRYLTGALGYGGPCFPRDDLALGHFARSVGTTAELPDATDRANRRVVEALLERLRPLAGSGRTAAVLGLAYKPGTPVTEASQALELAQGLARTGATVLTYDPLACDEATAHPLDECIARADLLVVASPDPAFRALSPAQLARLKRGATVIDCWRILDEAAVVAAGARYVAVGRGAGDEATRRLREVSSP